MSIRAIRELKITNENKDDIQAVLDENTDLKTALECLVYLRKNPLVYYDGLKDLSYYELYMLIQHKIRDVLSPFNHSITTRNDEDLYYELRLTENITKDSHLITKMAEFYGESNDEFFERIQDEKEENLPIYLRFAIDYKNDKIKNIINMIFDEIKDHINLFLSNYKCNVPKDCESLPLKEKNIYLRINDYNNFFDIELHLPFFLFNMNFKHINYESESDSD